MKHRNLSPGEVEEGPPKKHKAKRKVSELDEVAAKVSTVESLLVAWRQMLTIHPAETKSGLSCSASLQTTQGRHDSISE